MNYYAYLDTEHHCLSIQRIMKLNHIISQPSTWTVNLWVISTRHMKVRYKSYDSIKRLHRCRWRMPETQLWWWRVWDVVGDKSRRQPPEPSTNIKYRSLTSNSGILWYWRPIGMSPTYFVRRQHIKMVTNITVTHKIWVPNEYLEHTLYKLVDVFDWDLLDWNKIL